MSSFHAKWRSQSLALVLAGQIPISAWLNTFRLAWHLGSATVLAIMLSCVDAACEHQCAACCRASFRPLSDRRTSTLVATVPEIDVRPLVMATRDDHPLACSASLAIRLAPAPSGERDGDASHHDACGVVVGPAAVRDTRRACRCQNSSVLLALFGPVALRVEAAPVVPGVVAAVAGRNDAAS